MDSWANARRELHLGRRGERQMMGVRLGVHGRWGARSGHWGIRRSPVRHAAPNEWESLPGHSQSSLMILPSLKEFSLGSLKKSQIHQTLISLKQVSMLPVKVVSTFFTDQLHLARFIQHSQNDIHSDKLFLYTKRPCGPLGLL